MAANAGDSTESGSGGLNDGFLTGLLAYFDQHGLFSQWYWCPGKRGRLWHWLHGRRGRGG
jgi:hypothetical protein